VLGSSESNRAEVTSTSASTGGAREEAFGVAVKLAAAIHESLEWIDLNGRRSATRSLQSHGIEYRKNTVEQELDTPTFSDAITVAI